MHHFTRFAGVAVLALLLSGCGLKINPFSPEVDQKINNQQGKIEELKNNQNGINTEVGKLRQELDIANSKIHDLQEGIVNVKGSTNENTGVQILQGNGGLILVFALGVISLMLLQQFLLARKNAKIADMLTERLVLRNNPEELEDIYRACLYTNVEKDVYKLITKHQAKFGITD